MEEIIGGEDDGGTVAGQVQMGNGVGECDDHPVMVNHGGVCAFCVQEKLAKLGFSSLPLSLRYSSSSSSSPSFQSDCGGAAPLSSSITLPVRSTASRTVNGSGASGAVNRCDEYFYPGMIWISFLMAKKKKSADMVLKRSKSTSTTTPKRNQYRDSINDNGDFSQTNRDKSFEENSRVVLMAEKTGVITKEDETLNSVKNRKLSMSRSVGCGSRSFAGDIFKAISTRSKDCSLRRVESQKDTKRKVKQGLVKHCGLFGGFMVTSSSSSQAPTCLQFLHCRK